MPIYTNQQTTQQENNAKKLLNKNLLIIGAGLLQVPAIKKANEMGLKTIVTDYNKDAPGMKIADYPLVISTRDIEGTVRVVKDFNTKVAIDGVITVGTDASMTVAAVANALSLPGIPFENAEAATNKIKMRERLKEHGVPIPKFFKCWSYEELLTISCQLGYPFVMKPSDNMGARGVIKVESEAYLKKWFEHSKSASPSGELIVEEYMKGPELSIDALIYNNEIFITGVADRIIEREPYFIELGHVMPSSLSEDKLNDAIEVFKQGIRALGLTIGAAKGDIKITDEGAKIGEIAARLSGGFMSAYTYPYSCGVDLIRNAIEISLGLKPSNLIPTKNDVSIEMAIIPKPGILKEISGIDETLAIPGVKNIFIHKKIGDEIKEPQSNVEKTGNIIVAKSNRQEAWDTINKALKTIRIKTEPKFINWNEIRHNARVKFNGACFVCNVCNGMECKGKIPGIGGIGNGGAFIRNYNDFQKIYIKTRVIHKQLEIDTSVDFLGVNLKLPLLAAPITGCDVNLGDKISEIDYDNALMQGCHDAGILGLTGDGAQPHLYKIGLEAIKNVNGWGGIIYKPRADQKDIIKRLEDAKSIGVKFVGVDVDGSVIPTMALFGQEVKPKSQEELKELIDVCDIPFIVKGIMSKEDALKAVEAGAHAIVISNHGGRITENHPSSISVLPEIVDSVREKVKIIVDGGIRTGEDIFKAIALGADLVMIGRPFSVAVLGGGEYGVKLYVKQLQKQLKKIMQLTGVSNIAQISKEYLQ